MKELDAIKLEIWSNDISLGDVLGPPAMHRAMPVARKMHAITSFLVNSSLRMTRTKNTLNTMLEAAKGAITLAGANARAAMSPRLASTTSMKPSSH